MLQMEINGVMVDVVLKSTHLDRMNAKQVKIEELEQSNSTLEDSGGGYKAKYEESQTALEASNTKLTEANDAHEAHKAKTAVSQVLVKAGITDPYHQQQVINRHSSLEGDTELSAWLEKDAKKDTYVGHVFGTPAAKRVEGKPPPSNVNNGNNGDAAEGGVTPEQYKDMSAADQSKNALALLEGLGYSMPQKPV